MSIGGINCIKTIPRHGWFMAFFYPHDVFMNSPLFVKSIEGPPIQQHGAASNKVSLSLAFHGDWPLIVHKKTKGLKMMKLPVVPHKAVAEVSE